MPKYTETMVTSKLGINHVRTTVESEKCIFHKIEQENDLGVDAIVELIKNGVPLNKQIAVQIKSGNSYYNSKLNKCFIPVKNHFDYWVNYPLGMYGIVYIPSLKTANWIDIKSYLNEFGDVNTIEFERTKTNIIDVNNFTKIFIPAILNELPKLSFDEAETLFQSNHLSENYLGLLVLFRSSPNVLRIWDLFIDYFKTSKQPKIPFILIYYLAHIPWHPDISYCGEQINQKTKEYVQSKFENFEKKEIVKLLSFVDEENTIERDSIGQSVQTIISSISNRNSLLLGIVKDNSLSIFLRERASLIFAYHNQKDALPVLESLSSEGSSYAGELIKYLNENGFVDPYA